MDITVLQNLSLDLVKDPKRSILITDAVHSVHIALERNPADVAKFQTALDHLNDWVRGLGQSLPMELSGINFEVGNVS
ncbi:hypothetical protein N7481_003575 [Penicillium waksmanii]|uniref:uncharacterized protein n=1 Tax=Penicillium waksmanii TaxID=69791 RepID=UPI002548E487|nr:uncharacterized protein N7481_003575 [Penicillium waksmanii]KAJ5988365.1 hypothetical protein N7481_003575 [Penicillium waksmanii]